MIQDFGNEDSKNIILVSDKIGRAIFMALSIERETSVSTRRTKKLTPPVMVSMSP